MIDFNIELILSFLSLTYLDQNERSDAHITLTVPYKFIHSIGYLFYRYWDTLLDSLWPRFMKIVEMNALSVKQTDPQKLGNIDIQPHYVSLSEFFLTMPYFTLKSLTFILRKAGAGLLAWDGFPLVYFIWKSYTSSYST